MSIWNKFTSFFCAKQTQLCIMLTCYITTYMSRTHISAGHAYLIQEGILTAKHFGLMSAISYGWLILFKIGSGFILDYFQKPKYCFVVSAAICAVLTYTNTIWKTPLAFIILYTMIKCGVTFHRISILKTLRQHYDGSHFGLITSLLQAVSCIGEAGSKFLLGFLLCRLSSWENTWNICASITLGGAILYAVTIHTRNEVSMHEIPAQSATTTAATKKKSHFVKECIQPLLCNPAFWLIMLINAISTVTREIMFTLSPQLFTTVFHVSGEQAAMLQGLNALPGVVCLVLGGAFVDRFYRGNGIPFVLASLFFSLWSMAAIYFTIRYDSISLGGFYVLYFIFQGSLSCPVGFLDGYFVVQFFPKDSIAMGSAWISAAGYFGAIATSLIGRYYTCCHVGWIVLLRAALIAVSIQFILMILLNYIAMPLKEVKEDAENENNKTKSSSASPLPLSGEDIIMDCTYTNEELVQA